MRNLFTPPSLIINSLIRERKWNIKFNSFSKITWLLSDRFWIEIQMWEIPKLRLLMTTLWFHDSFSVKILETWVPKTSKLGLYCLLSFWMHRDWKMKDYQSLGKWLLLLHEHKQDTTRMMVSVIQKLQKGIMV